MIRWVNILVWVLHANVYTMTQHLAYSQSYGHKIGNCLQRIAYMNRFHTIAINVDVRLYRIVNIVLVYFEMTILFIKFCLSYVWCISIQSKCNMQTKSLNVLLMCELHTKILTHFHIIFFFEYQFSYGKTFETSTKFIDKRKVSIHLNVSAV